MLVLDFEVFKYDWLVVIYDIKNKEYTTIINNKNKLQEFYNNHQTELYITYNGNHYDYSILRAILSDVDPYLVSKLIVADGKKPWLIEKSLKIKQISLNTCDLMVDLLGISLKELEAYMEMSIEESDVSFDLDRKLTQEEIDITVKYCKHDVDATTKFLEDRAGYIKSKFILMNMFNLPKRILSMTSAQIAATVLQAQRIDRKEDALIYNFPDTLVLNKYNQMLPMYQKQLDYRDKFILNVAGVDHLYSYGGLHGAIPNFSYIGEMWQIDATSYYPTMILQYNYIRNIKDFERYRYIYEERVRQKKLNKDISSALKLVLNSTFGAFKASFNDFFDEHMSNQICISGQLFITDLIEKIEPYCKLVHTNTDGMLIIPYDKDKIKEELDKFEKRTRIKFEIDVCNSIYQKDVNNYLITFEDGHIKSKGGYVGQYNRKGADRNVMQICDIAIVDYFAKHIPVEKTINECQDIFKFQIITKTGGTYGHTYWNSKNGDIEIQRINRVYASKDKEHGNIFKTKIDLKSGKLRKDSVANVPEHSIVDNDNKLTINDIDKINNTIIKIL